MAKYFGYWGPNETDSDTNGILLGTNDINWDHQTQYQGTNSYAIMQWIVGLSGDGTTTSSTYNLYEDQVTVAGEVYTDALFKTHTDSYATNKRVYGFLVIPIENFAASGTSNDYFIPNFIPKTLWSYGDVGHDYCLGMASNSASDCNTYENYYDFSNIALTEAVNAGTKRIDTSRFTGGSANDFPEGQSMWWQVLDTSGTYNKGVGLWAQISIKDSYDGACQRR